MPATLEKSQTTTCKRPANKRKMSAEERKYWGLWKEIFTKFGVPTSQQSDWRKDLRMQVLGSDRTQATFSHSDYDLILGAMKEMLSQSSLVVFPEKLIEQYENGERRRMVHLIDNLDMPEPYIAKISFNKFGSFQWRKDLYACELKHLFYTISARKRSADKKEKHIKPTPSIIEVDDDFPF